MKYTFKNVFLDIFFDILENEILEMRSFWISISKSNVDISYSQSLDKH